MNHNSYFTQYVSFDRKQKLYHELTIQYHQFKLHPLTYTTYYNDVRHHTFNCHSMLY